MKIILSTILLLLTINTTATDSDSLKKTLNAFLLGATINDAVVHEKFWADELVYTSSNGTRFDKSKLMKDVNLGKKSTLDQATLLYTAEAIEIREFDGMAVVTFTLVASNPQTKQVTQKYLNSGVMIWRDNRWQAVNWHATKKT